MLNDLRSRLSVPPDRLEAINSVLLDTETRLINDFLTVVAKYGTPEEINQQADDARQMPALLEKVKAAHPEYLEDLDWLEQQRMQQESSRSLITDRKYLEKKPLKSSSMKTVR